MAANYPLFSRTSGGCSSAFILVSLHHIRSKLRWGEIGSMFMVGRKSEQNISRRGPDVVGRYILLLGAAAQKSPTGTSFCHSVVANYTTCIGRKLPDSKVLSRRRKQVSSVFQRPAAESYETSMKHTAVLSVRVTRRRLSANHARMILRHVRTLPPVSTVAVYCEERSGRAWWDDVWSSKKIHIASGQI